MRWTFTGARITESIFRLKKIDRKASLQGYNRGTSTPSATTDSVPTQQSQSNQSPSDSAIGDSGVVRNGNKDHAIQGDLLDRAKSALVKIRKQLLQQRNDHGHWVGELSASALSTSTAISTLSFYLDENPEDPRAAEMMSQRDSGLCWLSANQNEDGGWGDTEVSYSNISTTMLVIAALHAAKQTEQFSSQIAAAQKYVDLQGGIPAIRKRYGKDKTFAVPILANCAMAGIVDWKEVSALPFEAACVPQRFYNLVQMPVVSYAVPALVAIGQAKYFMDPPWNPISRLIRRATVGRSLNVLDRMKPASGGFLEAVPLTSFVAMSLIKTGRSQHSVAQSGLQFILDSFLEEGSWPIDTNLATWTTTLSVNAVSGSLSQLQHDEGAEVWNSTLDWILACQYKEVHPFTGAAPGGWGWSDLSGAVPDADDTPGALLSLANLYNQVEFDDQRKKKILDSVQAGMKWLLDLQNRDKGWPTFCRGWGRFPFDRSGSDITAHALRALIAWKGKFPGKRVDRAIERGFRFLDQQQCSDGSWNPLWFGNQDYQGDLNPCYGTSKVLLAYRDAERFDTKVAQKGLNWIALHQEDNGGWGGGKSLRRPMSTELGTCSVEETALCLEALALSTQTEHRDAVARGTQWLVTAIENDLADQSWPIGFYFAKLWYYEKLYPLIFATSAMETVFASGTQAN